MFIIMIEILVLLRIFGGFMGMILGLFFGFCMGSCRFGIEIAKKKRLEAFLLSFLVLLLYFYFKLVDF